MADHQSAIGEYIDSLANDVCVKCMAYIIEGECDCEPKVSDCKTDNCYCCYWED